jgi:hypothetical protein
MIRAEWSRIFMLSEQQRRTALKKNIEYARDMARRLRADGVEGITLTHYADEESFHIMRLPEEGDDFEYRQMVNAETAKIMITHGLQLEVQVLDAKEYFEWLGTRQNTYQAQHEYPGADTYLGTRLRLCLGSNSRAGYLSGPGQSRQAAAILARARQSPPLMRTRLGPKV